MSFDASDLRRLATDLGHAPAAAVPEIVKVYKHGATNIKRQLRREASASLHFGQIARTIDYDFEVTAGEVDVELGPNKSVDGAASLANIAYFGSSKPGGGTLPDPRGALDREAPRLEENVAKAIEQAVAGDQ